ncbi:hypothetical protein [Bacillus timonensis]|uniref:hypothetical protein n=1 Tax=Bacillus timonensis TaxID=1033734 RepID=UPI001F5FC25D|nr:hypothetical protein [Bacillus timonensis]
MFSVQIVEKRLKENLQLLKIGTFVMKNVWPNITKDPRHFLVQIVPLGRVAISIIMVQTGEPNVERQERETILLVRIVGEQSYNLDTSFQFIT